MKLERMTARQILANVTVALCSILFVATHGFADDPVVLSDYTGTTVKDVSIPAADSFSGAMSYNIPIEVPAGRNGMAPKLSLTYNSTKGNGWMGAGWDVGSNSIEVDTRFGFQDYSAESSVVSNSGQNPLNYVYRKDGVCRQLVKSGDCYHVKFEQDFTKIQQFFGPDNLPYWQATDKSGVVYRFGYSSASRQDDPNNPSHIFKWCLDKVIDPNGNYMVYYYTKDQGQIYLSQIGYTGNGSLNPTNQVIFYRGPRTDVTDVRTAKFSVKTANLLNTIDVLATDMNNHVNRVRSYRLDYTQNGNDNQSILTKVQQFGKDAILEQNNVTGGTSLPPITLTNNIGGASFTDVATWHYSMNAAIFTPDTADFNGDGKTDVYLYINDANGWRGHVALSNGDGTFTDPVHFNFPMNAFGFKAGKGDFNGDGKTDLILQIANSLSWRGRIALSNGDGTFSDPIPFNFLMNVSNFSVGTGDFNGDGKTDILLYIKDTNSWRGYVALSNGDGTFAQPIKFKFPMNALGSYMTTGDFNGDGMTDLLLYKHDMSVGLQGYVALSNGDGTFADPIPFNIPALLTGCQLTTGDFNGDGNTDLLLYRTDVNMSWLVILSNGDGTFSKSTPFPVPILGNKLAIGDANGDGKTDLLLYNVDINGLNWNGHVYFSEGDGTFATPTSFSVPVISDTYNAVIGDFNGDGKSDFILVSTNGSFWGTRMMPSAAPMDNLLTAINDGIGGSMNVTYQPSTIYSNTQLPFPVQTVSSITTCDSAGANGCNGNSSTTNFTYSGGFYHIGERDLRGFNYAKTTDPAGPNNEQKVTETWFHQGNETDILSDQISMSDLLALANVPAGYMKGKPYRKRVSDGSMNKYLEGTMIYAANTYSPYFFTPTYREDSYLYDGYSNYQQTEKEYTYDGYGNILREEHHIDMTDDTKNRTIVRTYSYNTSNYIVGLPSSENIYQGTGTTDATTQVAGKTYYYDDLPPASCGATPSNNQTPDKGNLTRTLSWLKGGVVPESRIAYDQYGNPVCTRDPNHNVSTITYDAFSYTYPTIKTNPLGQPVTTQYYAGLPADKGFYGQVKTSMDPNNAVTAYEYDPLGRKTKITNPDLTSKSWNYNNFGTVGSQNVRTDSSIGLWQEVYFDGLSRNIKSRSSGPDSTKPVSIVTGYDARGAVAQKSLPYFDISSPTILFKTYRYDPMGRPLQANNPDGTRELYCYYQGVKVTIDANNHRKRETYDPLKRLVAVDEYTGTYTSCSTAQLTSYATTHYAYDVLGNLTNATDAKSNVTSITYDTLNRKTAMHDPDMGNWSYTYDSNGNLLTQTDAKNITISFGPYDPLNRVTRKHFPTGTDVTNTYDEPTSTYPIGRLTTMTDESGTTKYFYDPMGRTNKTVKTILQTNYTMQMLYDWYDRIKSITYPDNETVTYTYDTASNLTQVTGTEPYASFLGYNAFRQAGTLTLGNNAVTTAYGYYPLNNRLQRIQTTSPSQGGLLDLTYYYDNKGNIQSITDNLPGGTRSQSLLYDELDRLTQAQGQNTYGAVSYSYDQIGNILTKEGETFTYPTDGVRPHAVIATSTGRTYHYDPNGNMDSDNQFPIVYTDDNRPRTYNGLTSFYYDGNGRRGLKISSSKTTVYVDKLYECVGVVCNKYIFAGNARIAMKTGNQVLYYNPDRLGSTAVVVDKVSGVKTEDITYYPFGKSFSDTGSTSVSYKFTSQELDTETELYNYKARWYNPTIGRFISPDSLVPNYKNPQSLNRYSYVQNNPLLATDPTGHDLFLTFDANGFRWGSPNDTMMAAHNQYSLTVSPSTTYISSNTHSDAASTQPASASQPVASIAERPVTWLNLLLPAGGAALDMVGKSMAAKAVNGLAAPVAVLDTYNNAMSVYEKSQKNEPYGVPLGNIGLNATGLTLYGLAAANYLSPFAAGALGLPLLPYGLQMILIDPDKVPPYNKDIPYTDFPTINLTDTTTTNTKPAETGLTDTIGTPDSYGGGDGGGGE